MTASYKEVFRVSGDIMDVKPVVNITFEENPAVFHVGKEAIKGNVEISLTRLMKAQMIKVEFKGVCQMNWKKRGASNKKYNSDEHFNIEDMLLTPRSLYNDLFLQPGSHNFPFVFDLPQTMPPTFTATDGKIEYFARAIVQYREEGSMEGSEVRTEAPFVMKKSIANFPTKFLQNIQLKERLSLPKMFSRPVVIEVISKMPKRIFQRGEIVRLTCDYTVVNGKKKDISDVYAVLMQGMNVVKRNGQEITRRREVKRAPPFSGSDGQEGSSQWSDIYMTIPTDIPLTIQGCGNITVFYYIQIRAKSSKENIDIPILIIDRDETSQSAAKPRERRLSLTSPSSLPSMFQTFNTFNRNDSRRSSITSIESLTMYYGEE